MARGKRAPTYSLASQSFVTDTLEDDLVASVGARTVSEEPSLHFSAEVTDPSVSELSSPLASEVSNMLSMLLCCAALSASPWPVVCRERL